MMVLCKSIRRVEGGYIVEARYPFGGPGTFGDCGEVVCKTFVEVVKLLHKCDVEPKPAPALVKSVAEADAAGPTPGGGR